MKWIVLIIMGALGLGSLAGGLIWLGKRYQIIRYGIEADGLVVDQQKQVSSRTKPRSGSYSRTVTSYYPVVEFTTEEGEKVRFVGSSGGVGKPLIETGAEIKVVYIPSDPVSAVVSSFSQVWLGPLVISVAGIIFLAMAFGSFSLISTVDRTMDQLGEVMKRDALYLREDAVRFEAKISEIREIGERGAGNYVLVARGIRPGGSFSDEFLSEYFTFRPDSSFIGRQVTVSLDPFDRDVYAVELGLLLREIMQKKEEVEQGRKEY